MSNIKGFYKDDNISSDYLPSTIIPKGTKLDCYVNPYGVNSGISKGWSTYYIIDEEMTISKAMDLIEKQHGYKFSEEHVELTVNPDEEDNDYINISRLFK